MIRNKMYYLVSSKNEIIGNILEVSEPWCWARFWQRQNKKNKNAIPANVPPDWINGLKEIGYSCHTLERLMTDVRNSHE